VKTIPQIGLPLKSKLLVSCQSSEGEAFRDSESMARFALAAVQGGAAGIRAEGAADVRAIRAANIPGWTGTRLGDELRESFDFPVAVENDAHAMAVSERHFGAG
jgi:N-acylglucosamine-6-phosphate 2-epimerase